MFSTQQVYRCPVCREDFRSYPVRCQIYQYITSSFNGWKCHAKLFLFLYFFRQKEIGKTEVCKMLVILTTGDNFINFLHLHFFEKRKLASKLLVKCLWNWTSGEVFLPREWFPFTTKTRKTRRIWTLRQVIFWNLT